jgi:tetratricopeptide (TPR) repeat protein
MTILLVRFALWSASAGQHETHPSPDRRATLMRGLGKLHHQIATRSRGAQQFFNQDLTLVCAFNHDEVIRSFRRVAELDPASPMPRWGIALALGPNINLDVDPAREKAAYNKARNIVAVMDAALDARIAAARQQQDEAVAAWKRAVDAEDVLNYDEPPDWFYPTRESLGAALLAAGRGDEAERVFSADLERNPRNGRSLFGLWQSLLAQGRSADATRAERAFEEAWTHADVELKLTDY